MSYKVGSIDVLHTSVAPLNAEFANCEGEPKPSTTTLPKGHKRYDDCRAFDAATVWERDITIPLRDGTKLYGDVFRPADVSEKVPIILVWSPYGKSGTGFFDVSLSPYRVGVPRERVSGYQSFEAPDPAVWTALGYAVVNVDARGIFNSEGDHRWHGTAEGRDGYDTIEYLATLPWCNERVTLMGNSWLATAQWYIAAERPPHLTAMMPLEGLSDVYRETLCRGGVPWKPFWKFLGEHLVGRNQREDSVGMIEKYPLLNEYWDDKRAKSHMINIPAYVLASMSTSLHTVGSTRSFEDIPHDNKWLRLHSTQEWHDLYADENIQDFKKFLDFYLKDAANGWDRTPRVRVSVIRYNQPSLPYANFSNWPIPESQYRSLYLQGNEQLSWTSSDPDSDGTVSYKSDAPALQDDNDTDEVQFRVTFTETTTVIGPSKAVLYMSCREYNDLDVFVQLRKADKDGKILRHCNVPAEDMGLSESPTSDADVINVMYYLGPSGILRASHRKIDPVLSKPHWPAHDHTREEFTEPGDIVKLEIGIWVGAIQFEAGEQLVLKIAGHHMALAEFEPLRGKFETKNEGQHVVHFGSQYQSHLQIPVVPNASTSSSR